MAENRLDMKDRRILYELDRNCRQSNAEIGKKVRLSKEVVKYRIDRMMESGLILRFHTVVNYFKLGIVKYKLYLRFRDVSREKMREIGEYFNGHKKTEWVAICTGGWDMIVGFLVRNVNEFDGEVQQVMNRFSSHIQEKAVTATLHLVHHLREYLEEPGKKGVERVVYHTSADEQAKVDGTDLEILRIIANNARIHVTEIAKRLRTTSRIVQYRMKRMKDESIILAYKVQLDPKVMGNIFCKAIIYLRSSTKGRIGEFVNYCSSIPEAVWPQRVMGAWDFELDFELEDYDTFQDIMFDMKERFSSIIQNYDFAITKKEFKLDLFPGAYSKFSE
jgi:Lrp/AsnC family leucine-responsive transcriptional regulator